MKIVNPQCSNSGTKSFGVFRFDGLGKCVVLPSASSLFQHQTMWKGVNLTISI